MNTLIEMLLQHRPVLTDGGWGTELQKRGLEPGESPEALNLRDPEAVEAVARAYVEAGSRIILTNTFGGNRFVLERHGLADKVREINRAGAALSRKAAGDRAKVFASLGPSGKMVMMGEVTLDEIESAFAEQAEALAEGGADALVIETMSDPEEAAAAVRACRSVGLPVVASMVYDSGPENDRTMMGTTVEEATAVLIEAGADVVGANCGQGIEGFVPLCCRLKAAAGETPVWIKANAGLPEMENGRTVYRTTPETFASFVPALIEAGADFIGGCCGTSPAFIRAVKELLSTL